MISTVTKNIIRRIFRGEGSFRGIFVHCTPPPQLPTSAVTKSHFFLEWTKKQRSASKLFGSGVRSIQAMFKALKAYFRVNFQLERLINETENRFCQKFPHFGIFCWSFLTFFGVKKVVLWIFSKLFKSSIVIVCAFSLTLRRHFSM